ncbi:MAG: Chemotaxis protein CheY [Planctomycetota bacterium]|jgi:two-component system chemotaxis response regulator CheY
MHQLMIVDDALIMRMKIREIATRAGWNVVAEASSGKEAVQLYQTHQPNLVTMDLVMPELDGLEALRAIRQLDPNASVVMVSAVNQKDKLRECIAAGAVDFIIKPFQPNELQAFFERVKGEG